MSTAIKDIRPIQCIFYSHVWAIHMLKHAGLGSFENQVLIELATISNLAAIFGEQGKARFGLAGMLRLSGRLEQFAQEFKNVPARLILAPKPEIPASALCSAVGLLATTPSFYQKATLLVHLNDAPQFASAYPYVNCFSMLWDIADVPTPTLVQLAQILVENHCITQETWRGFHLYKHPNRPVPDMKDRLATLKSILDDYPTLSGNN
jgi:hypothetical protein